MIGLRTYLYFSPNKLQGKRKTVVKCIPSRVEINIPLTMILRHVLLLGVRSFRVIK